MRPETIPSPVGDLEMSERVERERSTGGRAPKRPESYLGMDLLPIVAPKGGEIGTA
jgi:hypothetical protein